MMDSKKFENGYALAHNSLVEYLTGVLKDAFQSGADGKIEDSEAYITLLGDALDRSANMELQAICGYLGVKL